MSEPICRVTEIFDEDGEPIGYTVCGDPIGFPVYDHAEEEIEGRAASGQPNMVRYTEDGQNDWITIKEIQVPTEYDKEQLLMALKYLHDCYIDTEFLAVNSLVHLYTMPEKIKVTR